MLECRQSGVLARVLGGQRDGVLLTLLSFGTSMGEFVTRWNTLTMEKGAWAWILPLRYGAR